MTYRVIWNGSRTHAGGALLFADESREPIPAPPIRRVYRDTLSQRMRSLKDELPEWFTSLELAIKVQCTREQANRAIGGFVRNGELQRGRKLPMARVTYRWLK